jgi:hypothetical protein
MAYPLLEAISHRDCENKQVGGAKSAELAETFEVPPQDVFEFAKMPAGFWSRKILRFLMRVILPC